MAVVVALSALSAPVMAAINDNSVLLTFEDLPASNTTLDADNKVIRNGAITVLAADIDGMGFSIQRRGGAPFDIIDHDLTGPRAFTGPSAPGGPDLSLPDGRWGQRSIDPFVSFYTPSLFYTAPTSRPLFVAFDTPIHIFSVLIGDFGGDSDAVTLRAFTNSAGTGSPAFSTPTVFLNPASGNPGAFTQIHSSFATSLNILGIEVVAGSLNGTGTNRDFLSMYLDRMYFNSQLLEADKTMLQHLDEHLVFDENAQGDSFFQAAPPQSIPEPLSAAALIVMLPMVLSRRLNSRLRLPKGA